LGYSETLSMSSANLTLVEAFPSAARADALAVISVLPEVSTTSPPFSVSVGSETLAIPCRIYHDPSLIHATDLTETQARMLSCLLTRHHDGFVREEHLRKILESKDVWIPPFVVQLVGEYVVETINEIRDGLNRLDPALYGSFLRQNRAFYQLTKQRVLSYWNCYYHDQDKTEYAGFQVLEAFERFAS
jgi:hypothetical protein